ncbi:unnamed protein product, partial [Meganyctiphanes norvegica]
SNSPYIMKTIVFSCLLAVAIAAPQYGASRAASHEDSQEHIPILRDDRLQPIDGSYSFDTETADGIVRSEHGARIEDGSAEGAVAQAGSYSFTLPNGEEFELTYVANEGGFQPQSDFLPVAPAFPHPIPDFVLEQIEKARLEDLNRDDSDERPTYYQ